MKLPPEYALVLIVVLFLGSEPAHPCSCKGPPTTEHDSIELIERSDIVLLGRLDEAHVRLWAPEGEEKLQYYVKISVLEWFKGGSGEYEIDIELTSLDCASGLHPGNTVLIFASVAQDEHRPNTHWCNMHLYELARPDYATENVDLRNRLTPLLEVIRSESW